MAKKNSGWLVNEITETAMKSAQTESHLQELNWMIGRWSANKPDDSAELNIEWAKEEIHLVEMHFEQANNAAANRYTSDWLGSAAQLYNLVAFRLQWRFWQWCLA